MSGFNATEEAIKTTLSHATDLSRAAALGQGGDERKNVDLLEKGTRDRKVERLLGFFHDTLGLFGSTNEATVRTEMAMIARRSPKIMKQLSQRPPGEIKRFMDIYDPQSKNAAIWDTQSKTWGQIPLRDSCQLDQRIRLELAHLRQANFPSVKGSPDSIVLANQPVNLTGVRAAFMGYKIPGSDTIYYRPNWDLIPNGNPPKWEWQVTIFVPDVNYNTQSKMRVFVLNEKQAKDLWNAANPPGAKTLLRNAFPNKP